MYAAILVGLSVGFMYLFRYLMAHFDISATDIATTAYLVVFVTTLISNASIIIPVAIHISVMIAVSSQLNPTIVALVASVAGALGEITGYYVGYLGKKMVINERTPGYDRLVNWMTHYGSLAIFLISLQPILPVDIAGLISGASRIPLWKFLLPCWAGKFLKYLVICYFGYGVLNLLPIWPGGV